MGAQTLQLKLHLDGRVEEVSFGVRQVVIAGWTGRDVESVLTHIQELELLGVPAPSETPLFYLVSRELVTTDADIEVVGPNTSGELECVLFVDGDQILLGLGSDHTDRKLEIQSVSQSKQVCPKPVGENVWRLADVIDHWDLLQMESRLGDGGPIYQSGVAAVLRPALELLATYRAQASPDPKGLLMFCGTLPVHGGVKLHPRLDLRLYDPVRNRELRHNYTVTCLPNVT